jgi:UDPglucose--hexose-1-phosphate uridylyltransferase
VVPNKFPALSPEAPFACSRNGLYQGCAGYGVHEVIIEQPGHILSPTRLTPEDFGLVVRTYCERSRVLAADAQLAYVLIFKNVGERAGASLEHSHSQIIGVPVMPRRVAEEIQRCAVYHDDAGGCLFCAIIEEEQRDRQRVVIETDEFLVVCPYAGRFPFEMWLMPKAHSEHFMGLDEGGAAAAARVMHEALSRLELCLDDPPFNFAIHTAPVSGVEAGHYHWHIEIIPRVTHVAGFEWGTGFYINPVAPEQAAECLRNVSAADLSARAAASMVRDG